MALLVPVWREAAVIGSMLRHTLASLDYPNYHIFVGVYPNDCETLAVVASIDDPRLSMVINRRDGGTTKGDNLNSAWLGMLAHEQVAGERFDAVVLHDAEDLVHPRELHIFDHLLPRRQLIQLPVMPLPDRGRWGIAATYQDEFAEAHLKDLVTREAIGAAVPSAGVACAIDRSMLDRIAAQSGKAPFDSTCVTEDYEIGLRIHALGGRGCLVRMRSSDRDPTPVATREHFPGTFRAAVRQKARWLLGIALQGWDRVGWQGGLANRLMLLRDRKAIVAALVMLLAYFTLFAGLALALLRLVSPIARALPPLAPPGKALRPLLFFNSGILAWRLTARALCVWAVCGPREALKSLPRTIMGNLINISAAAVALWRYVRISIGIEQQRWDKTEHRFPELLAE